MNMKMNYLKFNFWVVVVLMGMCLFVVCSDDNSGEGGGNGDSEEVIVNNGILKGSVDGLKIVILIKGYNFFFDGEYIVKVGFILKIGEGVIISVKSDDVIIDYIFVEQGVKIEVVGIVFVLIVMIVDIKELGVWGGIYICGKVLINIGLIGKLEVGDVVYGGFDLVDNLGILKYICLEYVGYKFIMEKECNGFIFYGVGNGMIFEYFEVYKGIDDGFEWFGGMVNVKYLVLVSNSDDLFDWIEGWSGKG